METMEIEKQQGQYRKMTETPVSRLIIMLGIPTIISMLITNIYNMADTYFVSRLGTSASGATGVVFGLMAILQAFGFMFGHGAGSIISRRLGKRDYESASRFASTSFFLAFGVGCAIGMLGILFLTPFMRVLGSTETILPYAKEYGFFILLAGPFMAGSCVLNNILRYEGRAAYAMVGLTLGGVLNMIGDPILMFGFKMGTTGAGLSTALSQIISFLVLLSMFLSGKTNCKLSIRWMTKDIREVGTIIVTGFPSMIRQGLGSISIMILNGQAAVYGDAAIAAMSIVNRIIMFVFSVGLGMGQGFQPVAAFNYGAGKYSRVRKGFWFTVGAGEVLLGVLASAGLLLSGRIIGVFRDDPAVIEIGTLALRWQCVACFFLPLSVCGNMMFQSVGKSGMATFLSALRSGVCFIPLILILPRIFGLTGIQTAQAIADVIAFFITLPLTARFLKSLPRTD
ncbi:MAG: MATE family efflux transporter [Lachnospiraceae bacterium]|nr:MATE family efflux transporter [Lachnospiraceae bacterium]MDD3794544.1 MATE family efflux transporter [Lachnospiraceae bacterium]